MLAPGDLLTVVVLERRGPRTTHGSVLVVRETRAVVFAGGNSSRTVMLNDEGASWIRGHHAPDSEEAQALLATFTLVYLLE